MKAPNLVIRYLILALTSFGAGNVFALAGIPNLVQWPIVFVIGLCLWIVMDRNQFRYEATQAIEKATEKKGE